MIRHNNEPSKILAQNQVYSSYSDLYIYSFNNTIYKMYIFSVIEFSNQHLKKQRPQRIPPPVRYTPDFKNLLFSHLETAISNWVQK